MLFHSLTDGKCQIVKGRHFSKSRYVNSYITYLSRVVRKPASSICKNKGADQLRGNHELISAFVFAT